MRESLPDLCQSTGFAMRAIILTCCRMGSCAAGSGCGAARRCSRLSACTQRSDVLSIKRGVLLRGNRLGAAANSQHDLQH